MIGAALIVLLNNALGLAGFTGVDIVTGAIFVLVVLLFRRGIWGSAAQAIGAARRRRRSTVGSSNSPADASPQQKVAGASQQDADASQQDADARRAQHDLDTEQS